MPIQIKKLKNRHPLLSVVDEQFMNTEADRAK